MKKVFTIIVTYNGSRWIDRCMQHLLQSTHPTNIIIADNASTGDTLELLKKYAEHFTLIPLSKNLGFGGGNNAGILSALPHQPDYIFLLNQDAYVEKECIGQLVESLEQKADYGIVSPLQLDS
ncbi:MAG: glycosyltransferase, partial [Chitinophagaceae bacterium]